MGSRTERSKKAINHWFSLGHKRCAYCHCQLVWNKDQKNTATVEHLVPKCQGGTEALVNLIVVCQTCNNRRGHTDLLDWVKGRPLEQWITQKYINSIAFYNVAGRKLQINKKKVKNLLTA